MTTKLALEGFTIKSVRTEDNPNWGGEHTAWKVTVKNPRGRKYTGPFCMGILVEGEPTVEDVLGCMVMDASGYVATQSFDEWAREYGYVWETRASRRKAEAIYNHCGRMAAKVEKFLTPEEIAEISEKY